MKEGRDITADDILENAEANLQVSKEVLAAMKELRDNLASGSFVLVDRSVIEEALEQIEDTWRTTDYTGGGEECASCGAGTTEIERGTATHEPTCKFVRVRDALKALVDP